MRRIVRLALTLPMLIAVTFAVWNHRFERTKSHPVGIEALKSGLEGFDASAEILEGSLLRITRRAGTDPLAFSLPIHGIGPVLGLHFSFSIRSQELVPGEKDWEDGRFLVDWHDPTGDTVLETDYVCSIRSTCDLREKGMILVPPRASAIPTLRFEHQGISGYFDITELSITPVKPRAWLPWGILGVSLAWASWVYLLVGSHVRGLHLRRSLTAILWCLVASQLILPGPWKNVRPLMGQLDLGNAIISSRSNDSSEDMIGMERAKQELAVAVPPSDNESVRVNSMLRIKLLLSHIRPLLHALMLAAPALAFMLLVGIRQGGLLAALMAGGIEFSQIAFGYGFDWEDVIDLFSDGVGIFAAAIFCRCLLRRYPQLMPMHSIQ